MKGRYEALLIKERLVIEGSLACEQADKALFHSGVCYDIWKMKKFNVKKLFVT